MAERFSWTPATCIDSVVTDFDQRPTRHLTIQRYRSYRWRVASGNGRHLGHAETANHIVRLLMES